MAGERGARGERERGARGYLPAPLLASGGRKDSPPAAQRRLLRGGGSEPGGNIASLASVPIPARIANALVSYAVYLGQFFWPVGLAAFYPRSENLPAWQVGGACLVLAALSLARPPGVAQAARGAGRLAMVSRHAAAR